MFHSSIKTKVINNKKKQSSKKRLGLNIMSHKPNYNMKIEVKCESVPQGSSLNNCRICLKTGTVPIFGSERLKSTSESLKSICAIEISENDNLPKHLCTTCYNSLQRAILFRNTAQKTDEFLRQPKLEVIEDESADNDTIDQDIENGHGKIKYSNDKCVQSSNKKKNHCNRCNIDFDTRKSYSNHIKSNEHRNFKVECPICKGFYTTVYIKKHMLRHRLDPEQAFICDICGKSFVIMGAFRRHKAIHNFELPYKCELCPYRGRFSECLKLHMRTHTGEKPYACSHCPARFINKSNLNKHSSTHKTEHDYKCDGCGRGYFRKRDLEQHIKVYHSGLKEHVCNICSKAFGYRKQMMKHQLKVHKREKLKSGRVPLYLQAEKQKMKELEQIGTSR